MSFSSAQSASSSSSASEQSSTGSFFSTAHKGIIVMKKLRSLPHKNAKGSKPSIRLVRNSLVESAILSDNIQHARDFDMEIEDLNGPEYAAEKAEIRAGWEPVSPLSQTKAEKLLAWSQNVDAQLSSLGL